MYIQAISTHILTSFSVLPSLSPCAHFLVLFSLLLVAPTNVLRREPISSHLEALFSALQPDGSLVVADSPSCRVLPSPLSEEEARFYYAGLSSAPILVARSSITPWEVPTSPDTYQKLQELRAAFSKPFGRYWEADVSCKREALLDSVELKRLYRSANHPLMKVWEGDLRPTVCAYLDGAGVKWNSVEPFYIGREERSARAILLIGVDPGSLEGNEGDLTATECNKLLFRQGIDVDLEIREWIKT